MFLEDSYLKEFRSDVVRVGGREVVLARTAFFPGGGGQPADKGALGIGPVNAAVVDVRREGGSIVHVLDRAIPDTVKELKGALDWERRYAHMRHHTALHVLSGVIWKGFEAKVTGGKMYADRARMDFSFPGEWTVEVVGEPLVAMRIASPFLLRSVAPSPAAFLPRSGPGKREAQRRGRATAGR